MSIVPATFLLIMALNSALIVWLVAREVAVRGSTRSENAPELKGSV